MATMSSARVDPVRYSIIASAFWMAVAVLPITGLDGVQAFGELKGMASVYVLLLTIVAAAPALPLYDLAPPRPLLVFLGLFVGWIALGAALNLGDVAASTHQGRTGLGKLITASLVLGFGLSVAALSSALLRTADDVRRLFVEPLVVATLACGLFALPELSTWVFTGDDTFYRWTTGLFHPQSSEEGRQIGRLMSLSFEAPDFAYFCGILLPWLLLYLRLEVRHALGTRAWVKAVAPLALGVSLLLLANSRTGYVMLGAWIAAEMLFWIGLRRLRWQPRRVVAVVAVITVTTLAVWLDTVDVDEIGQEAPEAGDVSTTSRLALLVSQLSIFREHPLLGVGFGQFGFHALPHLPDWAWRSYELVEWFESKPDLPPSFMVAGRLGSELGVTGLALWYGFWALAWIRAASAARALRASPDLPLNAAIFSTIAVLTFGGLGNDAFRRPETWMLMAIVARHSGCSAPSPATRASV